MWMFWVFHVMVFLINLPGIAAQDTPFSNLPANVTIPENTPPGDKIYTVEMVATIDVQYSFDSKTTADTFDVVRSESGSGYYISVKCGEKLDFENPKHTYSISFKVSIPKFQETRFRRQSDGDFGQAVTLSITLSDVNEAPVFNSSMHFLKLAENTGEYLSELDLFVTDVDHGDDNFTFEIVSVYPPHAQNYFQMEKATGKLTIPSGYDVDNNNQSDAVLLTIAAKDKGQMSGMTFLLVNIIDINDNSPEFSQEQQTVTVPQTLAVKSAIVYMQACDKDSGNNGKIKYSLYQSEFSKYFQIDSIYGVVTSTQVLPVAKSMSTELLVVASDQGRPAALTSTATITVHIVTNTETLTTDRTDNTQNIVNGNRDVGQVINSTASSCTSNKSCDVCKTLYENKQCEGITITKMESDVDISFLYWLLPLLFIVCTTIVIFLIVYFCVTKRKGRNNRIKPRKAIFAEANNNAKPKPILVKPAVSTVNGNLSSTTVSVESMT